MCILHIKRSVASTITSPAILYTPRLQYTSNPVRGHKERYCVLYKGQRVTSWSQPAIQTIRDPNRNKILTRSNHPRASETYRRQDDVFGYEPQLLLSEVLLASISKSELQASERAELSV